MVKKDIYAGKSVVSVCAEAGIVGEGITNRSPGRDLGTRRSKGGMKDGKMQSCILCSSS